MSKKIRCPKCNKLLNKVTVWYPASVPLELQLFPRESVILEHRLVLGDTIESVQCSYCKEDLPIDMAS
jgi:hypothetical protein